MSEPSSEVIPADAIPVEVIPATPEEKTLLEIAVRLACAIQYWERNVRQVIAEDRFGWFQEGIENEMVRILPLFLSLRLIIIVCRTLQTTSSLVFVNVSQTPHLPVGTLSSLSLVRSA